MASPARSRGVPAGLALALWLGACGLAGCAETAVLRSRPPGATVWVNGRRAGRTPLVLSVLPADWAGRYAVRLEKPGYRPRRAELETEVSRGRVIGGILSLGLSLFFKQPETFACDEYVFDLAPAGRRRAGARSRPLAREAPPSARPPGSARRRVQPPSPGAPGREPFPARPQPPSAKSGREATPATASATPAAGEPAQGERRDVAAELERLRKLRDDGMILDAEYEQLRSSILEGP